LGSCSSVAQIATRHFGFMVSHPCAKKRRKDGKPRFVERMNHVLRARWRRWRRIAAGAAAVLHALLLPGGEFGLLIVIQER
jgi:hypothetical protein